ncbi:MAG: 2-succinyl-5-enolpyruvyl-6-hydroxy-3-cyclohexene-1-carboxylic-acid synthase [Muribaculaceae bacterium]|nr:2-succinyl-5-enolpyruvyl-6-hydroxy-3-cyclohexene-1-carboxylic-acid synthase [Muribaculaceae bacterium]
MLTTANQYVRLIIDCIASHGVGTAYCSPGSRNAPLLIALESHREILKHVVVDERSAAFQALGCALVERTPVLLVCTSGTAVLNYAPAVAEAYYAGVPLIIVSADRPSEWIDQDDSQTIRQFGVLSHIVKASYDVRAIPEDPSGKYTAGGAWRINRTVNEAMLKALEGKPGPVHINVQLGEPLGMMEEIAPESPRIVEQIERAEALSKMAMQEIIRSLDGKKIMLVAGFMRPDNKLDRAVRRLAALPNVVVMAETLSNLHTPARHASMIDAVLCRLTEEEKEELRPEVIISIGGALVSRMLKQYLRLNRPDYHITVGHSNYFCDCFQSLTTKVEIAPAGFIAALAAGLSKSVNHGGNSDFAEKWLLARKRAAAEAEAYVASAPWSDLTALHYLLTHLKLDNLFLSNGTVVRYSQLIAHSCHAEYCNRGVSGIDGTTATAVGGAVAYSGDTTLISGDMSWLYDSGVSTLGNMPGRMKCVVIDNSGGGIFRFIKSTSSISPEILDTYFCAPSDYSVSDIAEAYGYDTFEANDLSSLEEGVKWLDAPSDLPGILVVHTPPEVSAEVLKGYFAGR